MKPFAFHRAASVADLPPGATIIAGGTNLLDLMKLEVMAPDALVDERVTEVAEEWGLASVASRPLATLSRGWRQRFFLAQALLADPDILILDEPAVALDECGRQQLFRRLRLLARERVVIVGGHGLRELTEVADRVLVMRNGRVAATLDGDRISEENILGAAMLDVEAA